MPPIFHFILGLFLFLDNSIWLNNNFHLVTGSRNRSLKLASPITSDLYSIVVKCYLELRSQPFKAARDSHTDDFVVHIWVSDDQGYPLLDKIVEVGVIEKRLFFC